MHRIDGEETTKKEWDTDVVFLGTLGFSHSCSLVDGNAGNLSMNGPGIIQLLFLTSTNILDSRTWDMKPPGPDERVK